jgi:lipopolysaccharide transport system ATP-binding protein
VGSLLEVGTGFHHELTGRENIYMNGAILGMKRAEIDRKFDEIVAFAEVEQFLDTPVKRYSSGMYVRLAFAVAAHLEPEILIVDEVLAVGDARFQQKCLGKMGQVAQTGRTVLFVSHNMAAVRALCGRCIYLRHGAITAQGQTDEVLRIYQQDLQRVEIDATTAVHDEKMRRGNGAVRFTGIQITDDTGAKISQCHPGQAVRFEMEYRVMRSVPRMDVFVGLRSGKSGEFVTSARHEVAGADLRADHSGAIVLELPAITLRPGEYLLYFWLGASSSEPFDVVDDLTAPLAVVTEKHTAAVFDHAENIGFFDIQSRLVQKEKILPPDAAYLV